MLTATIELSCRPNGWYARFVNDPEIMQRFGTDTLPTSFTARATADTVLAAITALNPGAVVTFA